MTPTDKFWKLTKLWQGRSVSSEQPITLAVTRTTWSALTLDSAAIERLIVAARAIAWKLEPGRMSPNWQDTAELRKALHAFDVTDPVSDLRARLLAAHEHYDVCRDAECLERQEEFAAIVDRLIEAARG